MFNLRLCTARPLDIPLEDRMVSNVTFEGPMTAQQDYRFTVTVTWKPPVYPYKKPMSYLVKWFKEESPESTDFKFVGLSSSVSKIGFCSITSLYSCN